MKLLPSWFEWKVLIVVSVVIILEYICAVLIHGDYSIALIAHIKALTILLLPLSILTLLVTRRLFGESERGD
jgi:hypothetical protein